MVRTYCVKKTVHFIANDGKNPGNRKSKIAKETFLTKWLKTKSSVKKSTNNIDVRIDPHSFSSAVTDRSVDILNHHNFIPTCSEA